MLHLHRTNFLNIALEKSWANIEQKDKIIGNIIIWFYCTFTLILGAYLILLTMNTVLATCYVCGEANQSGKSANLVILPILANSPN